MFKKKYLSIIVFLLFLFISIGYSLLNSTLNINGKSSISKNNWDIHFDNININYSSVEPIKYPTYKSSTSVDFELKLDMPGDFFEFTIDIVNSGTIDAMIESIDRTPNLTETQEKYLNYIIEYEDGESISEKQIIKAGNIVRLKVKVEFRENINASELPQDGDFLDLGFSLNYLPLKPKPKV